MKIEDKTYDECIKSRFILEDAPPPKPPEEIISNNITFYKEANESCSMLDKYCVSYFSFYTYYSNRCWELWFDFQYTDFVDSKLKDFDKKKNINTFNQMFSTFKFIERPII